MLTAWYTSFPAPQFNPVWLAVSPTGLASISLQQSEDLFMMDLLRRGYQPRWDDAARTVHFRQQILEYLAGERRTFDLPIDWSSMRPFQTQVLKFTCAVPYGQTTTYRKIAIAAGRPAAARAVGRAEATNPIPLVIPCHRVVGTDGSLHGYGGAHGIEDKRWLLDLESR